MPGTIPSHGIDLTRDVLAFALGAFLAAVILTAGSSFLMPDSIFSPIRTMAIHFYILAREGISAENAYGTAAVLILSVLLVNMVSYGLMHRFVARRG